MKLTMSAYKRGIVSLHNLMGLLHSALDEVMPSVELARAGGYAWRGYVIRDYQKQLAQGHYFCQIYISEPTILLMEEFCNYNGMYYPWRVDYDLRHTPFFDSQVEGQKAILVNFYREALKEALIWQNSTKRHSIVPEKIWGGHEYYNAAHLEFPTEIYRVTNDYVSALTQQNELFNMLIKTIKDELPKSGLKKPYFKHNINGWSYRGLWMKPRIDETEEEIPEGSFPFTFKIDLFEHPEYLRFESDEGTRVLDLETNYFFNLAEDHQRKTLEQFLEQCRLVEQVKELI